MCVIYYLSFGYGKVVSRTIYRNRKTGIGIRFEVEISSVFLGVELRKRILVTAEEYNQIGLGSYFNIRNRMISV